MCCRAKHLSLSLLSELACNITQRWPLSTIILYLTILTIIIYLIILTQSPFVWISRSTYLIFDNFRLLSFLWQMHFFIILKYLSYVWNSKNNYFIFLNLDCIVYNQNTYLKYNNLKVIIMSRTIKNIFDNLWIFFSLFSEKQYSSYIWQP